MRYAPDSLINRKRTSAESRSTATCQTLTVEYWPIGRLEPYERNPRKNDKAVDRMRQYSGVRIRNPPLARSTGEVIDGHLRLKAAFAEKMPELPVIVCDGWTDAQVKAFRLMVNRSVTWADWDLDALALEFGELKALDFDLSLTGFDSREIDAFTLTQNAEEDEAPPVPEVPVSKPGDLWLCGPHRVMCGSATNAADVALLLGPQKPFLMVTDPPYGIELDSEWRDRAGLNGHGAAEPSYMKRRTAGHTETTISGDTRADWSEAFELVPSLQVAYVWHASAFTREVLNGLLRIGFLHHQQVIWDKTRIVLTRTHYWFEHEPCWYVRKKNAPWFGKPGENSARPDQHLRPVCGAASGYTDLPETEAMSEKPSTQPLGQKGPEKAGAKKPYRKPAFEWERAFETMALACGKVNINQAQCKLNRKVS